MVTLIINLMPHGCSLFSKPLFSINTFSMSTSMATLFLSLLLLVRLISLSPSFVISSALSWVEENASSGICHRRYQQGVPRKSYSLCHRYVYRGGHGRTHLRLRYRNFRYPFICLLNTQISAGHNVKFVLKYLWGFVFGVGRWGNFDGLVLEEILPVGVQEEARERYDESVLSVRQWDADLVHVVSLLGRASGLAGRLHRHQEIWPEIVHVFRRCPVLRRCYHQWGRQGRLDAHSRPYFTRIWHRLCQSGTTFSFMVSLDL